MVYHLLVWALAGGDCGGKTQSKLFITSMNSLWRDVVKDQQVKSISLCDVKNSTCGSPSLRPRICQNLLKTKTWTLLDLSDAQWICQDRKTFLKAWIHQDWWAEQIEDQRTPHFGGLKWTWVNPYVLLTNIDWPPHICVGIVIVMSSQHLAGLRFVEGQFSGDTLSCPS